jgi:hypothetical protein
MPLRPEWIELRKQVEEILNSLNLEYIDLFPVIHKDSSKPKKIHCMLVLRYRMTREKLDTGELVDLEYTPIVSLSCNLNQAYKTYNIINEKYASFLQKVIEESLEEDIFFFNMNFLCKSQFFKNFVKSGNL